MTIKSLLCTLCKCDTSCIDAVFSSFYGGREMHSVFALSDFRKRIPKMDSLSKRIPKMDWWPRDAFRIRIIRFSKTDSLSKRIPNMDWTSKRIPKTDSLSKRIPNMDWTSKRIPKMDSPAKRIPNMDWTSKRIPKMDSPAKRIPNMDWTSKRIPKMGKSPSKRIPTWIGRQNRIDVQNGFAVKTNYGGRARDAFRASDFRKSRRNACHLQNRIIANTECTPRIAKHWFCVAFTSQYDFIVIPIKRWMKFTNDNDYLSI